VDAGKQIRFVTNKSREVPKEGVSEGKSKCVSPNFTSNDHS